MKLEIDLLFRLTLFKWSMVIQDNGVEGTHIVDPFDTCFEFGETKVYLNGKYNCPVCFAAPARFWFCTTTQQ